MNWDPLIEAASEVRDHAYSPYSGFMVGAAILAEDGSIHAGCNVENRSFGATICAERVAIGTLLAGGVRGLRAVVVVSDTDPPAPPCGLCLQVLSEFGERDLPVLLMNSHGTRQEYRLRDLSPHPFELPPQGLGRFSG